MLKLDHILSIHVQNYIQIYHNPLICSKDVEQNVIFNINQGP